MEKVNGQGPKERNDNCKREFDYAVLKKNGNGRLIGVPMEPGVNKPETWFGSVGMNLGGDLYPCSFADSISDSEIDKLAKKIRSLCANAQ